MLRLFFCVLSIFLHPALSQGSIQYIDFGKPWEDALVFHSSGRVTRIPTANKFSDSISKIKSKFSLKKIFQKADLKNELNLFYPSVLSDLEEAKMLFKRSRTDFDEKSQCFSRAHIWSYEWRIKKNFLSSKIWLFFTPKYIREHKFEWWFHVAPMVHVKIEEGIKERVMDIKYSKGPLKQKQWTDIFIRNNTSCLVVEKYTDYAHYPESADCFVMKSSMYYYRPIDLEREELSGEIKTKWIKSEVAEAYLDGFKIAF